MTRRVAGGAQGRDLRYLTDLIPTRAVGPTDTNIGYLKQTTRTLPAVGDMQLDTESTSAKPTVTSSPIWQMLN